MTIAHPDHAGLASRLLAWRPDRQHVPAIATVVVFVLLYVTAGLRYDHFLSYRVFENLLRDNAVLGLTAIGMTFVILSGGIDLSVGAIVGLVSILVARLVTEAGISPYLVLPAVVLAGTLFGLGQGALIAFFALPPFLVTLAGLFLARGLALVVSRESISIDHPLYEAVFDVDLVPVVTVVFFVVLVAGWWLAHLTRFGRSIYAIGGNEQSAVLMGIAVKRTKMLTYALSGFCASLAGVMFTFYLGSGRAMNGEAMELDAIAAVVIGGTLLTGGVGYVAGTLIGVMILGIIQMAIIFEGSLPSYAARIAVGGLLLAFILLQKLAQGRAGRT